MSGIINQAGAKSGKIHYYPHHNSNHPNYDRPGDGHYTSDKYTGILIPSDSTNNATNFLEIGNYRLSLSHQGSMKHDTGYGAPGRNMGTTGINFYGGNSTFTLSDNDNAMWQRGDWSIDFWFLGTSGASMYGGQHTNGGNGNPRDTFGIRGSAGSASFFYYGYSTSTQWLSADGLTIDDSKWHHYAVTVDGGEGSLWPAGQRKIRFFQDGNMKAEHNWPAGNGNNGNTFWLGKFIESNTAVSWSTGFLSEFRFSNGIARWTRDFQVW